LNIIITPFAYINGVYKRDMAIIFDEIIHEVCPKEEIPDIYRDIPRVILDTNSVLYPGFINAHVHLEFSSNETTLTYGDFMPWLESVMANRDEIAKKSDKNSMQKALHEMLLSGITSIGAISSFGGDLEVCANAKQRVVYFNEVIGSNETLSDNLYTSFKERFLASHRYNSDRFEASVAIHSPYSVHPKLLNKVINLAKKYETPLSAHFLESREEREWLSESSGGFKTFFEKLFFVKESITDVESFLEMLSEYPALFVHATQIDVNEIKKLQQSKHSIVHCPRSNRLLGQDRLKIELLGDIVCCLATDGKSSNWSLNIFDEMRAALMLHSHINLHTLSHLLLKSITLNPAQALGLNCGIIAKEKYADFSIVRLRDKPKSLNDIALWTILHTRNIDKVYIQGEQQSV
jgi:cytosine/adenosine deaminase-related metal-dependent hydrolase